MREAASRRASRRLLLRKEVARASLRERRSGSVRVRPSVRVPVVDFIRMRMGGGDAREVEVARHPLYVVVVQQRPHRREQQSARHQHRQRAAPVPPQHHPHQRRTNHRALHTLKCARPARQKEGCARRTPLMVSLSNHHPEPVEGSPCLHLSPGRGHAPVGEGPTDQEQRVESKHAMGVPHPVAASKLMV